ncbi:MAG: hypothetical protein LIO46_03390 [Clostridiales bacterium]|nr:hypothetical protein [Clostridiales bacterium]
MTKIQQAAKPAACFPFPLETPPDFSLAGILPGCRSCGKEKLACLQVPPMTPAIFSSGKQMRQAVHPHGKVIPSGKQPESMAPLPFSFILNSDIKLGLHLLMLGPVLTANIVSA